MNLVCRPHFALRALRNPLQRLWIEVRTPASIVHLEVREINGKRLVLQAELNHRPHPIHRQSVVSGSPVDGNSLTRTKRVRQLLALRGRKLHNLRALDCRAFLRRVPDSHHPICASRQRQPQNTKVIVILRLHHHLLKHPLTVFIKQHDVQLRKIMAHLRPRRRLLRPLSGNCIAVRHRKTQHHVAVLFISFIIDYRFLTRGHHHRHKY